MYIWSFGIVHVVAVGLLLSSFGGWVVAAVFALSLRVDIQHTPCSPRVRAISTFFIHSSDIKLPFQG